MRNAAPKPPTQIWDPILRVTHWSLAAAFAGAYWLGGNFLSLHAHLGYCVGLLITFRCFWGVAGPGSARFANFVLPPAGVWRYLREFVAHRARRYRGHDPAGGALIVLLLLSLLATVLSGVLLFGLMQQGPLRGIVPQSLSGAWLQNVHHWVTDLSLILVIIHITGVTVMSVKLRENLPGAMVTGKKRQ